MWSAGFSQSEGGQSRIWLDQAMSIQLLDLGQSDHYLKAVPDARIRRLVLAVSFGLEHREQNLIEIPNGKFAITARCIAAEVFYWRCVYNVVAQISFIRPQDSIFAMCSDSAYNDIQHL